MPSGIMDYYRDQESKNKSEIYNLINLVPSSFAADINKIKLNQTNQRKLL